MSGSVPSCVELPPDQEAIRARCFHPNGTFKSFGEAETERSIVARFEETVRNYPQRIAVKAGSEQLTYDDLNRRANSVGWTLLSRRTSPEHPIVLFLERGLSPIVANIGVLKAGRFSLHVDPAGGARHAEHVFQECGPQVVVTDRKHIPTLIGIRTAHGLRFESVDIDEAEAIPSDGNPPVAVDPSSGAYIRYTSGSTGGAKPVLKTQRHVMHDVMNFTNYFHLCPEDRITVLGQDYLGKHVFQALLNGGTLFPLDLRKDGSLNFADWIADERITVYQSSPTAFRNLIGVASRRHVFSHLRLVRLDGEPVYNSDVELYRKMFSPQCVLVNSYSSTETGTISLYYIDKTTELSGTQAPAGYPVCGKEVLFLDDNGNEVESGKSGEVSVRSLFLSSGYWGRPQLTAEKFVSAGPHQAQSYRTGDLGQRSKFGWIELEGRKDLRVKIRNFSVDLTEIDAVLSAHPDVKHAAATRHHDAGHDSVIVGYVVARKKPPPTVSQLRRFLEARLPDYMIPTSFVFLSGIPLLGSGKIDRRALPRPERSRPYLDVAYASPETPLEKELLAIWCQVLELDRIGVHDSFLDLGGHSLAATRIVSQAMQKFQLDIPISALLEAPTIAEMATLVKQRHSAWPAGAMKGFLEELEALPEEQAQTLLREVKD